MDQSNDASITHKPQRTGGVVLGLASVGIEEPIVVGVFVVVTGDLLLAATVGIGLDMRMEQAPAISHVFQRHFRAEGNLQRRVFADLGPPKICLKQRRHLRVARSGILQDQEMKVEGEHVDHHRDNDETDHPHQEVGRQLRLGHFQIAKLVPEILGRVQADQRGGKQAHPLDAAHTADADAGEEEPDEPLDREAFFLKPVKPGPAEHGGKGEAEEHRVEEDEARDGRVRVLAQDHQCHQPDRRPLEVEFARGEIGQRNGGRAEEGVEHAHERVVDVVRVRLARLELERAVVSGQITGKPDQHLSQGRVDVEVELALQVVGTEFAKTRENISIAPAWRPCMTHCASSHVTMGESPILHSLVKRANAVKIKGARMNSYSSRN